MSDLHELHEWHHATTDSMDVTSLYNAWGYMHQAQLSAERQAKFTAEHSEFMGTSESEERAEKAAVEAERVTADMDAVRAFFARAASHQRKVNRRTDAA